MSGGGEVNVGVHFMWIPTATATTILIVLMLLKKMIGTTVVMEAMREEITPDSVADLANLFIQHLNTNKRTVLQRNLSEVLVTIINLIWLTFLGASHGLPWESPFPSSVECIVMVRGVRAGLPNNKISTLCSLTRSTAFNIGYSLLCGWLVIAVLTGLTSSVLRLATYYSLKARVKTLKYLMKEDFDEEMFQGLTGSLSYWDFDTFVNIFYRVGGNKRRFIFRKFAATVASAIN